MTTGQPIRFQSDRNKYNNEFNEALQLQINLNQSNLEANRLYKETGQLPASTQMMDTRSNEEKLADLHGLKQSIISDLAPIAEPMFASSVIEGVINSPLNVNNSLFRYLAQNASMFAQTLSKKYKFGIAGDVNDITIMIQFLEDAYVKTKNTFQSIKGYINSNTNEGNKTRSNVLSANDTDNLKTELKDIQKRIIYLSGHIDNGPIDNALLELQQTCGILDRLLPTSLQMQQVIQNISDAAYNNAGVLPDENLIEFVFDILNHKLPKLSSVQTLVDRLDRSIASRDLNAIYQSIGGLQRLFAPIIRDPDVFDNLLNFHNIFIDRADQELQRSEYESEVNYANAMRIRNDNEAAEKKAQRVYVINPANDPVHIIGNMNLGGGDDRGGSVSDSGLSYNLPFGNSQQGDPIQQRQDDYENAADGIENANINNPAGYARDMGQLNAQYQDLDGYGVLRDPQDHPVFGKAPGLSIPAPPSKKAPSAPSSTTSTASSVYDPTPISGSNDYLSNTMSGVASLLGINPPGGSASKAAPVARDYSIESRVSSLSNTDTDDLYKVIFGKNASGTYPNRKKAIREALIALPNYDPQYPNQQRYNIGGLGLSKPVKKGRGLYSPFGDSEINHKNLENNILTLRRKSKTNYMDLPSKHISKHMKNIIHNIVGGKIANFEDMHNLTDEERNYLSKVVKKSNLQDRLSVPAPSKDQADKDNHQWEVMRGEIMAGNDSHELVKKFKILTMKLTRQGLLPKNEVMDLFQDLIDLGY